MAIFYGSFLAHSRTGRWGFTGGLAVFCMWSERAAKAMLPGSVVHNDVRKA